MKTLALLLLTTLSALAAATRLAAPEIPNPLISFPLFQRTVEDVELVRQMRRLTEDQFLQAMKEPGVVLLDARSAEKYRLRHLQGAVNLSLPDFTEETLARIIPSKDTKVLIYCNNNFEGSPTAFAAKTISAALNLHSFVALRSYGYHNVYELGPLLHVATSRLPFAGEEVRGAKR
jgi:phage shock protein E